MKFSSLSFKKIKLSTQKFITDKDAIYQLIYILGLTLWGVGIIISIYGAYNYTQYKWYLTDNDTKWMFTRQNFTLATIGIIIYLIGIICFFSVHFKQKTLSNIKTIDRHTQAMTWGIFIFTLVIGIIFLIIGVINITSNSYAYAPKSPPIEPNKFYIGHGSVWALLLSLELICFSFVVLALKLFKKT